MLNENDRITLEHAARYARTGDHLTLSDGRKWFVGVEPENELLSTSEMVYFVDAASPALVLAPSATKHWHRDQLWYHIRGLSHEMYERDQWVLMIKGGHITIDTPSISIVVKG